MEKNKVMMIIVIVLLVILLAVLGTAVWLGYGYVKKDAASKGGTGTSTSTDAPPTASLTPEQIDIIQLDSSISLNLLTGADGTQHAAKVNIGIGIDNKEKTSKSFITMIGTKNVVLRDICIDVMANKTYEDLSKVGAKEQLKKELLDRLQTEFNSNLITAVYISDIFFT